MTIATLGDDMVTAGVVAVVEVAAGGAGCSLGGWGLGVVEGLDAGESSASSFACFLEGKHIYQRGEWRNGQHRAIGGPLYAQSGPSLWCLEGSAGWGGDELSGGAQPSCTQNRGGTILPYPGARATRRPSAHVACFGTFWDALFCLALLAV